MKHPRLIASAIGLALITSACSSSSGGDTSLPDNILKVAAVDYGFQITGEVVSGLTTIEFSNEGDEIHHGIIGRLDEGKTKADVVEFLQSGGEGPPPPWFNDDPGDISEVSPGHAQTVQVDLSEAGTYVFLCFMPTAGGGPPHVAKGMVETFDVAEGPSKDAALKPSHEVSLTEYEITLDEVTAGTNTFLVTNDGQEPHEFRISQLAEGKVSSDIDAWFEGGLQGDPPVTFYGGTNELEPGQSTTLRIALEPGTYQFVCGLDTEDGKNHADDLGMLSEMKVA